MEYPVTGHCTLSDVAIASENEKVCSPLPSAKGGTIRLCWEKEIDSEPQTTLMVRRSEKVIISGNFYNSPKMQNVIAPMVEVSNRVTSTNPVYVFEAIERPGTASIDT
jgi:hypothetical protein